MSRPLSQYRISTLQILAAAAKSLQSCLTLCDPIDGSLPGSPVPGILQARTLEWVAISLSNAWKWKVKVKLLSRVRLFATPWTTAYQAPQSMGFSRQEYWSGVPLPSPMWGYYLLIIHASVLGMWSDSFCWYSCFRKVSCSCSVVMTASLSQDIVKANLMLESM